MYARRFRLDKHGNLYADRLFCRLLILDPAVEQEGMAWLDRRNTDARAAKASAIIQFEAALVADDQPLVQDLARRIHVLMLAQRFLKPKHRVSLVEKALRQASIS